MKGEKFVKKIISSLLAIALIATSLSFTAMADGAVVISDTASTLIEFEDYADYFENKSDNALNGGLSGGVGIAYYYGLESGTLSYDIPVTVKGSSGYKVDFAAIKNNAFVSEVNVYLVEEGNEENKIPVTDNKNFDYDVCTPIQFQTVGGFKNGGNETYVTAGNYKLRVEMKKAQNQNFVIAILDFIKFTPVFAEISGTEKTTVEFENYTSYFRIVGAAKTSNTVDGKGNVQTNNLSGGAALRFDKGLATGETKEVNIPFTFTKAGIYSVDFAGSGDYDFSQYDINLVPENTNLDTINQIVRSYDVNPKETSNAEKIITVNNVDRWYPIHRKTSGVIRNIKIEEAGRYNLQINITVRPSQKPANNGLYGFCGAMDYISFTPMADIAVGDWTASADSISGEGEYSLSVPFTRYNSSANGYYLIAAMMNADGSVTTKYYNIDENLTDEMGSQIMASAEFEATENTAKIYTVVIRDITNPTLVTDIKEISNPNVSVNKTTYYNVSSAPLSEAAEGTLILTFEGKEADIETLCSFEYSNTKLDVGANPVYALNLSGKTADYRTMVAAYGSDKQCIDNTLYRVVNPESETEMKNAFINLVAIDDKTEFAAAYETFVKTYMIAAEDNSFADIYGEEYPISEIQVYENAESGKYSYEEIKDYVFAFAQFIKQGNTDIANNLTSVADAENLFKLSLFAYVMNEKDGDSSVASKYGTLLSTSYTNATNYDDFKALLNHVEEVTGEKLYSNMLNAALREKLIRSAEERKAVLTELSEKGLLGMDIAEFGTFIDNAITSYNFDLSGVKGDNLKNGLTEKVKEPKNLIKSVSPEENAQYVSDYSKIRIDFVDKIKADTINSSNIKIDGITLYDTNFVKGDDWCEITGLAQLLEKDKTYTVTVSAAVMADYLGGISGIWKTWSFRTCYALQINDSGVTTIQFEDYQSSVKQPEITKIGSSAEGQSSSVLTVIGDLEGGNGVFLEIPVVVSKSGAYVLKIRSTWPQQGHTRYQLRDKDDNQLFEPFASGVTEMSGAGTIYTDCWHYGRIYRKLIYLEQSSDQVFKIYLNSPARMALDYMSLEPLADVEVGNWTVKCGDTAADKITADGTYTFEIPVNFYRPSADDKYYVITSKTDVTGKTETNVAEEFAYTAPYTGIVENPLKTFTVNLTADTDTERISAAIVKNLDDPYLVSDIAEISRTLDGTKHTVTYTAQTDKLEKDAAAAIALAFKPGETNLTPENLWCFDYIKDVKAGKAAKFEFVNPDPTVFGTAVIKIAAFGDDDERTAVKDAECYMVNESALREYITDINSLNADNYTAFINKYMLSSAAKHNDLFKGEIIEECTTAERYESIKDHVLVLKEAILDNRLDAKLNTAEDAANLFKGALFTKSLFDGSADAEDLASKYGSLLTPLYTENTNFENYKTLFVKPETLTGKTYTEKLLSAALREEMLTANRERCTEIITDNADTLGINLTELQSISSVANISAVFNFNLENLKESNFYSGLKTAASNIIKPESKPQGGGSSGGSGGSGSSSGSGGYSIGSEIVKPKPYENIGADAENVLAFSDIAGHAWAADAIKALYEAGVVSGTGNNEFEPDRYVKREEIIKMICEAFKLTPKTTDEEFNFDDVTIGDWYYPYIKIAYTNGIVKGVSETHFGVGENVTRQDVAAMIYRFMQIKKVLTVVFEPEFTDSESISDYAKIPVAAMQEYGIITGFDDGSFNPHAPATRAEAAVMVSRLINHMKTLQ